MAPKVIPVFSGRFNCFSCGASWVGTWHGPKEQMNCVVCEKPLSLEKEAKIDSTRTS